MTTDHTVTTSQSDRHVVVRLGDRVIAETEQPMLVEETGMADRWYVPEADIAVDLVDSPTSTHCPWKGDASYRSMVDGPTDIAWSYPDPKPPADGLQDHWSFWGDEVTVEAG